MCLETMNTTSKRTKTDFMLRKTVKPGSKLRWRVLRVSSEADEAGEPCRAAAARTTVRKCLHRERRRAQLAKLAKVLGDVGNKEKREPAVEESPAVACTDRRPPGAMAPENTTQYLMSNAYEDMKTSDAPSAPASFEASAHLYGESLSPRGVYAALDSGYESCLVFQQRDFEEMFDLCW